MKPGWIRLPPAEGLRSFHFVWSPEVVGVTCDSFSSYVLVKGGHKFATSVPVIELIELIDAGVEAADRDDRREADN